MNNLVSTFILLTVTTNLFSESPSYRLKSATALVNSDIIGSVQSNKENIEYLEFLEYKLHPIIDCLTSLDPKYEYNADLFLREADNINQNDLTLKQNSTVRAYFIGETAGYKNTLGIAINGETSLIFPDASSDQNNNGKALFPGDFVELGSLKEGTLLDFFLIPNGARLSSGGLENFVYWFNPESNPDGNNHMKILRLHDMDLLIICLEDQFGGGDSDYNDLVFAVEIKPDIVP